jgi:hypothetical protein
MFFYFLEGEGCIVFGEDRVPLLLEDNLQGARLTITPRRTRYMRDHQQ